MIARVAAISFVFFLLAGSSVFSGTPPKVLLEEWKEPFQAKPKYFEVGVHLAEKPDKAFVVTGRVSRKNLPLKTLEERGNAADLAELAGKRQLLDFMFQREKEKLVLPPRLEKLATDSMKLDAHRRILTMRGVQTAARWNDDKYVWCTLVIAQKNVEQVGEFADSFRTVGASHYLKSFTESGKDADLYRAAEVGGLQAKEVGKALGQRFLTQGFRVAAFVVDSPKSRLPGPEDQLAGFLLKVKNPAWDEALQHFEAEKPDLDKALNRFLLALETRYADPDSLNYVGLCFKETGFPRMGSVFFEQCLAQCPKQRHRYALTNLGLCLVELEQSEEGRRYLEKAVQAFPKEQWTGKAREALKTLDAKKTP